MKSQAYRNFSRRLHGSARKREFPLRVMFELTYRCNFRCKHCYLPADYKDEPGKELSTREIFNILGQLADIGCFYLGFTGGEPFLRKDLLKILWQAKKRGFQIIIYTNGSLIDERAAKELKKLNPNKIDITVPAFSKNVFEDVIQAKGYRNKVFRAIEFLYKNGINLGLKSCLLKENEKEIKEIQDFADSLGVLYRLDTILSPRLDGDREPYRYRGSIKEFANQGKFNKMGNALFHCGVGVTQAAITPYGELKACLMIDQPRYKILNCSVTGSPNQSTRPYRIGRCPAHCGIAKPKENLRGAWQEMQNFILQIKADENYQCGTCKLYDYCNWCPGESWLYNKNFTGCTPDSLRRANRRMCNI